MRCWQTIPLRFSVEPPDPGPNSIEGNRFQMADPEDMIGLGQLVGVVSSGGAKRRDRTGVIQVYGSNVSGMES